MKKTRKGKRKSKHAARNTMCARKIRWRSTCSQSQGVIYSFYPPINILIAWVGLYHCIQAIYASITAVLAAKAQNQPHARIVVMIEASDFPTL